MNRYYIRYATGRDWTLWETTEDFKEERQVYDGRIGKCYEPWQSVEPIDSSNFKVDILTEAEAFLEMM